MSRVMAPARASRVMGSLVFAPVKLRGRGIGFLSSAGGMGYVD